MTRQRQRLACRAGPAVPVAAACGVAGRGGSAADVEYEYREERVMPPATWLPLELLSSFETDSPFSADSVRYILF